MGDVCKSERSPNMIKLRCGRADIPAARKCRGDPHKAVKYDMKPFETEIGYRPQFDDDVATETMNSIRRKNR